MAEQQLNRADVGAGFQEMDGKRVAQRMGRDGLGNPGPPMRALRGLPHRVTGEGHPGRSPGKSQGRDRLTRHQSRKISSSFGDSMT